MTAKPDLTRVWAAGAPGANVEDPDVTLPGKWDTGWLAEIPTFENFNFLQQTFTQGLAHNNEEGINDWDATTVYPIGGLAKGSDNVVYRSVISQSNNVPSLNDGDEWVLAFSTSETFDVGFSTYATMVANSDGMIKYAGQIVSTGGTRWRMTTVVNSMAISNVIPGLYAEPLGPIVIDDFGLTDNDITTELNTAVGVADGRPIGLLNKRYTYDGATISEGFVSLVGVRMPTVKADETTLEGGSIIEGDMFLTGAKVSLVNLGFDCGSASGLSSRDVLRLKVASVSNHAHAHLENIIALSTTSATHTCIEVENYARLTGGNVNYYLNQLGALVRCRQVDFGMFYGFGFAQEGLSIRSPTNNDLEYASIDAVTADGDGEASSVCCHIESLDHPLHNVNIDRIISKGCAKTLTTETSGGASDHIDSIVIGQIASRDSSDVMIDISTSANGNVESVIIDSLVALRPAGQVLTTDITSGNRIGHLQINNVYASLAAAATNANMQKVIDINLGVKSSMLNNVVICRDFDLTDLGAVSYNFDADTPHIMGTHICQLQGDKLDRGVDIYNSSSSVLIITPKDNGRETKSLTRMQITGNTTVIEIARVQYTVNSLEKEYETGHEFTMYNESNFTLTVNNVATKITNRAGAHIVVAAHESITYVYIDTTQGWVQKSA